MSDLLWTRDNVADGAIRYMNAEKYGLERIYFGGYFIRGMGVKFLYMFSESPIWMQDTQQLSQHFHMPSDFGVKGQSVHCSFDTRAFCACVYSFLDLETDMCWNQRGSIGAWIRNIDSVENN